ncbi:hypothetical protein [Trinickia violacea]|uniref:hypothetical protein n=1 Tax=Trinickia violacea TaxID=2571746 RepID=UPI001585D879|nr:hypothetical protein [Trinickia violacea]
MIKFKSNFLQRHSKRLRDIIAIALISLFSIFHAPAAFSETTTSNSVHSVNGSIDYFAPPEEDGFAASCIFSIL